MWTLLTSGGGSETSKDYIMAGQEVVYLQLRHARRVSTNSDRVEEHVIGSWCSPSQFLIVEWVELTDQGWTTCRDLTAKSRCSIWSATVSG